jgi:hypothetical protein
LWSRFALLISIARIAVNSVAKTLYLASLWMYSCLVNCGFLSKITLRVSCFVGWFDCSSDISIAACCETFSVLNCG